MQTNNSKEKVRQLQNKLYLTAKKCDSRRFHALYDKVYRDDVLYEAWKRVKANKGTSGVDGITIEGIETKGVPEYLTEIQAELKKRELPAETSAEGDDPKAGRKPETAGDPMCERQDCADGGKDSNRARI